MQWTNPKGIGVSVAMFNLIPSQWLMVAKAVAVIGLMAATSFGTLYVARAHYSAIISSQEASYNAALLASAQSYIAEQAAHDQDVTNAGVDHAQNQIALNALSDQLNGVRVKFPARICPSAGKQSPSGSGMDGASGMADARINNALAELQRGIDSIGQRCAQLNIDAIQLNKSVRAK